MTEIRLIDLDERAEDEELTLIPIRKMHAEQRPVQARVKRKRNAMVTPWESRIIEGCCVALTAGIFAWMFVMALWH